MPNLSQRYKREAKLTEMSFLTPPVSNGAQNQCVISLPGSRRSKWGTICQQETESLRTDRKSFLPEFPLFWAYLESQGWIRFLSTKEAPSQGRWNIWQKCLWFTAECTSFTKATFQPTTGAENKILHEFGGWKVYVPMTGKVPWSEQYTKGCFPNSSYWIQQHRA